MTDSTGRRWPVRALHPGGLAVATLFAVLAMTPSLMPRSWVFQGVVSGISAAIGYGVGVLLAWLLRRSARWRRLLEAVDARLPARARPWLAAGLVLVALAAVLVMLGVSARWQQQLNLAMGMPVTTTPGWLRTAVVLVVMFVLLLAAARGVRWLVHRLARVLRRRLRLPRFVAGLVAAGAVGALLIVVLNDVVLSRALSAADQVFKAANTEDHPGVHRPTAATRSGSPASLVDWDTLGREGRRFVAGGPTAAQLAASPAGAVAEPVRVYVGLDGAPDAEARAERAVAELERTGGFDRAVLLVVTTTGSGWVNEEAVLPLELIHGGDVATVSTQYSYLPSWISFLVDRGRANVEAEALLTAVEERLAAIPEPNRPALLVYGESLGSYGSANVFTSLADVRARTDGALWVGPPHSNELWRSLVDWRDPGTRQVEPVFADGLVVRFADAVDDVEEPPTPWMNPRVLFLQHRSDPIVWWTPELMLSRPDWVSEQPPGQEPVLTWYPFVTFWQVTVDMVNSTDVPDGHGHTYDGQLADAWLQVAAPEGWDGSDTAALHAALRLRPSVPDLG